VGFRCQQIEHQTGNRRPNRRAVLPLDRPIDSFGPAEQTAEIADNVAPFEVEP